MRSERVYSTVKHTDAAREMQTVVNTVRSELIMASGECLQLEERCKPLAKTGPSWATSSAPALGLAVVVRHRGEMAPTLIKAGCQMNRGTSCRRQFGVNQIAKS